MPCTVLRTVRTTSLSPMHIGADYLVWLQLGFFLNCMRSWRIHFEQGDPINRNNEVEKDADGGRRYGGSSAGVRSISVRSRRVAPSKEQDQQDENKLEIPMEDGNGANSHHGSDDEATKTEFVRGLDTCLELFSLLEETAALQGPLLIAQFFGCLVQGSACAYCGASIIFAFRDTGDGAEGGEEGEAPPASAYLARVFYSVTYILAGALMAVRIFCSCRIGQSIEDELQLCRWKICKKERKKERNWTAGIREK